MSEEGNTISFPYFSAKLKRSIGICSRSCSANAASPGFLRKSGFERGTCPGEKNNRSGHERAAMLCYRRANRSPGWRGQHSIIKRIAVKVFMVCCCGSAGRRDAAPLRTAGADDQGITQSRDDSRLGVKNPVSLFARIPKQSRKKSIAPNPQTVRILVRVLQKEQMVCPARRRETERGFAVHVFPATLSEIPPQIGADSEKTAVILLLEFAKCKMRKYLTSKALPQTIT